MTLKNSITSLTTPTPSIRSQDTLRYSSSHTQYRVSERQGTYNNVWRFAACCRHPCDLLLKHLASLWGFAIWEQFRHHCSRQGEFCPPTGMLPHPSRYLSHFSHLSSMTGRLPMYRQFSSCTVQGISQLKQNTEHTEMRLLRQ